MVRVAVIGGGISGLSTAYEIEQQATAAGQDIEVVVVESDERLGGKMKTDLVDGFICEYGPQGFVDNKPEPLDLCLRLGLDSELVRADDAAAKRYVFLDGRLQLLPMSPPAAIKTKMISFRGKLRAAWELTTGPGDPDKDESIAEFGRRHLGREIVDKLIAAMVVGIYAGDAEQLSLKSCFPVMSALEKEGGGSLIKAQMRRQKAKRQKAKAEGAPVVDEGPKAEGIVGPSGRLTTFNEGMAQIIERLKTRLKGDILTGAEVKDVTREGGGYTLVFAGGDRLSADAVVIATPAYVAGRLLRDLSEELASLVDGIPYVPVNVVVVGYDQKGFDHDLDGFGFLAPKREGLGILGALWVSSIFKGQAPDDQVAIRLMLGGAINPDVTNLDDADTVELSQRELRKTMGVKADPGFVRVIRHERAIPQYVIGHGARLEEIAEALKPLNGLYLTGNAYKGVGFNDCIINARAIAEQVVEYLESGIK